MRSRVRYAAGMPLLHYRAGANALQLLRSRALTPELVRTVLLPAVGPRWLVWAGLDRTLTERSWLSAAPRRCRLLGASIGAWRALAFAARDPLQTHARLVERYVSQHFTFDHTPPEVSRSYEELLRQVFSDDDLAHALAHPNFDLAFIAARARHPGALGPRWLRAAMLGGAAFANAVRPQLRDLFFQRVVFESAKPALASSSSSDAHVALETSNVRRVALASGTVPLYMEPVSDLSGAPAGAYIDGSITDYHVGQKVSGTGGVALLFLHQHKVVPGWLDKFLPWRHAGKDALDDVLLVYPDGEFVRSLPGSAIPSRDDFENFVDRPEERFTRWRGAVERSAELGAAFMEDAEKNALAARVQPL